MPLVLKTREGAGQNLNQTIAVCKLTRLGFALAIVLEALSNDRRIECYGAALSQPELQKTGESLLSEVCAFPPPLLLPPLLFPPLLLPPLLLPPLLLLLPPLLPVCMQIKAVSRVQGGCNNLRLTFGLGWLLAGGAAPPLGPFAPVYTFQDKVRHE